MRVILEVLSGPGVGRKTLVGPGQGIQIGRTEWADLSFPHDGHMSGRHFAVGTDSEGCYVEDLASSNGTFVNGQQISGKVRVNNGDEILAGDTAFRIRTEAADAIRDTVPVSEVPAAPATVAEGYGPVSYAVEHCESGLTLCRGSVNQIQPAELAEQLSRSVPLYLIVDFQNFPTAPPAELQRFDYLFDWLDTESVPTISPVVLSQHDLAGWRTLVEQGWGADAVVCIFSRQGKPALLEHLRRCVHAKPKRDDRRGGGVWHPHTPPSATGGIVGFCWPSVMSMLLAHHTPDFVRRLLTGIEAVLVELPDLAETWQLFGDNRVVGLLDGLEFARQRPIDIGSRGWKGPT